MEIKFDMDNFEHSLKQHADQFSMVPSKRVWNGVYNSLHPGSKWPSLTMGLIFLLTLVGMGPLNNSSKNFTLNSSPDNNNTQQSITEENESNLFSLNILKEEQKEFSKKGSPGKVINLEQQMAARKQVKIQNPAKNISNSVTKNISVNKSGLINNTQFENSINHKEDMEKSLNKLSEAIVVDIRNYKKDMTTLSKLGIGEFGIPLPDNYTFDLKDNFNTEDQRSLAFLLKSNPGKPLLIKIDDSKFDSGLSVQNDLIQSAKEVAKRNPKTTWIFFATPSVSTAYFTGNNFENHSANINSSSPLIVNPGQVGNTMRFNARFGLNVGSEMNYAFAEGWEIVSGAQISYSGYNIMAHKVHPTFSFLYLKNGANSMDAHKYITYYGSGLGLDEVNLHNKSLQLSVPIGIKHSVWKNNNMEIKIGASVQPSLLLNGHAYILSTDGRNYITDDELIRTVNVIGEFNSSISFQGDKVKWHVGPVVRYQALSTYKKNYPVNEHLVDYGIRIGISK